MTDHDTIREMRNILELIARLAERGLFYAEHSQDDVRTDCKDMFELIKEACKIE